MHLEEAYLMNHSGKLNHSSATTRPAMHETLRYGLAVASVAAALALTLAFLRFNLPQPFAALALSAIALTFWYAGTGPGIFAVVLSSIVRNFFFDSNINISSRLTYDLVFLVLAFLMMRVARTRNDLEQRVAERTGGVDPVELQPET